MKLTENQFNDEFFNLTKGWDWQVEGFIDKKGFVYPIDTDTKVISTIFERLSAPVLRSISKKYDYVIETANQTTYPDFTMSLYDNGKLIHRVAIDVKTTYFSGPMVFTLGGYNSFIRNDTKNILYPYSTYDEHWIIGFIYNRNNAFKEYDLDNMPKPGEIECPYNDVFVFIRQKHEITGLRAGSGNTKNIGSIKLEKPSDFLIERGPFCEFNDSKAACDYYWKYYEKYSMEIKNGTDLVNHSDFGVFK